MTSFRQELRLLCQTGWKSYGSYDYEESENYEYQTCRNYFFNFKRVLPPKYWLKGKSIYKNQPHYMHFAYVMRPFFFFCFFVFFVFFVFGFSVITFYSFISSNVINFSGSPIKEFSMVKNQRFRMDIQAILNKLKQILIRGVNVCPNP